MNITKRGLFKTLIGIGLCAVFRPQAIALEEKWDDPEWLQRWQVAPRLPITTSSEPHLRRWLKAIRSGRVVSVRYFGGDTPGAVRRISPSALFQVEDFPGVYLSAYCHKRQKPRTFRCDALELLG